MRRYLLLMCAGMLAACGQSTDNKAANQAAAKRRNG
jgi:hypothetical protein